MRTITTSAGTPIELDGDVLAIIEAVSRDLKRRATLSYTFEDVHREFEKLIAHLSEEEMRSYLKESLFMSFNRYENERLVSLVRKAQRTEEQR